MLEIAPLPIALGCFLAGTVYAAFVDARSLQIPRWCWQFPLLVATVELPVRSYALGFEPELAGLLRWLLVPESPGTGWGAVLISGWPFVVLLRCGEALSVLCLLSLIRLSPRLRFGLGDVCLLSALALALGFGGTMLVLLFASLGALVYALARRKQHEPLAFAPWIALALSGYTLLWLAGILAA